MDMKGLKKLKFAILLSIVTVVGMQASEATLYTMQCPSAKPTPFHEEKVQPYKYKYSGYATKTGGRPAMLMESLQQTQVAAKDLKNARFKGARMITSSLACDYEVGTGSLTLMAAAPQSGGCKVMEGSSRATNYFQCYDCP